MITRKKKTTATEGAPRSRKTPTTATKAQRSPAQEPLEGRDAEMRAHLLPQSPTVQQPTAGSTKIGSVLALMQRDRGTTLEEVTQITGWLPHTARAAMTGLRKKGHAISRTKEDGVSRYRLAGAAA